MRQLPLCAAMASAIFVALSPSCFADTIPWPAKAPVYDHIVVVVEENKDYEQINQSSSADFIKELESSGASFSQMFGEEHNSQGNYFWLYSGSNQGVRFRDEMPKAQFGSSNLGLQLVGKNKSFKGYAEDLPAIGSEEEKVPLHCVLETCRYGRKHVPWISFANPPHGTAADTTNLRFADFPTDYTKLPVVAFVIPNLVNDMHNENDLFKGSEIENEIKAGDEWLRNNLKPYVVWAKGHNSLLIVTFDESDHGDRGLTDPGSPVAAERNQIFTIFVGAHIKPGHYDEGRGITHVNILRTIEAMYGLPKSGGQQELAAQAGISDDSIITDVFDTMP